MITKNIVITGASGMIGSELIEKIYSSKDKIFFWFDDLSLGKIKFIKKFLIFHQQKLNFFLRIYRFPNVVGRNLTHGVIYDFKNKMLSKEKSFKVLGNGMQTKPYSFTEDIISAMLFLNKKKQKKIIINLGSGDKGISVKSIVNLFQKIHKMNKNIIYEKKTQGWPGDIVRYKYSYKYLLSQGFKFKYNSQKSLEKSIRSFRR